MIVIVCVAPYEWELFRRYHCNELLFSVISSFFSVARFALFYVLSIAVAVAVYQIFHFVCGRHSKSSFENSSVTGIFSSICSVLSGFIFFFAAFIVVIVESTWKSLYFWKEKQNKFENKNAKQKSTFFFCVYNVIFWINRTNTFFESIYNCIGIWNLKRCKRCDPEM